MSLKYIISVAVFFVIIQIYVPSDAFTINYRSLSNKDADDIINKVEESIRAAERANQNSIQTGTNKGGSLPVKNSLSLNFKKPSSTSKPYKVWVQFENAGEYTKACAGSTETAGNCTLAKNIKLILPDIPLPGWNPKKVEPMNPLVEAKPHSVPYQVWLEAVGLDDKIKLCGGSLISKKFVLSPAGCVSLATNISVILGAHDLKVKEPTQIHRKGIARLILRSNRMSSIAIIELTQEASLNENIGIAKLPPRSDVAMSYAGKNVNLCGWGPNQVLTYVEGTILETSECKTFYPNLADSIACWSPKVQTNICYNAPGSHVIYDGKMIALMIREDQICLSGKPVRLVRVTSILDWIEAHSDVRIG